MDEMPLSAVALLSDVAPSRSVMDGLVTIPEEEVWLAGCKSPHTRIAYARDVRHFIRTVQITSREQLRAVDHRAVIAWEWHMREIEGAQPTTIRRRLAALSSLFRHLVKYRLVAHNPVREVERPVINRWEGLTPAFTPQQARALLDAPDPTSLQGVRDRALLSIGLQVGLRRSEIVRLKVRDVHTNAGYPALRVTLKGGRRESLAIHPETAQRIRAYLEKAGHGNDLAGPLLQRVHPLPLGQRPCRHLSPVTVEHVLHTYVKRLGFGRGYSAHSMRATFITTALDNGVSLEDVQRTVGHADPSTTQLYDRRRFLPAKSAALVVRYPGAEDGRAFPEARC
jgi:site-specific recombinase XerD